jgi:hypothetical protein
MHATQHFLQRASLITSSQRLTRPPPATIIVLVDWDHAQLPPVGDAPAIRTIGMVRHQPTHRLSRLLAAFDHTCKPYDRHTVFLERRLDPLVPSSAPLRLLSLQPNSLIDNASIWLRVPPPECEVPLQVAITNENIKMLFNHKVFHGASRVSVLVMTAGENFAQREHCEAF